MNASEMIPCDQVIAKLWEYIDGDLDGQDAAAIEAHLDACARCFPEYDFRRIYRAFIRQTASRTASPELRHRIFETLLEEDRQIHLNRAGRAGALARARALLHTLLRRRNGRE